MVRELVCYRSCVFFFFKQKTAYEMRISDWSSDVCSSDLSHDYEGCHPHGSSLHCGGHGHDDEDHDHDHDHDHEHEEVPFVKLRSERFDIRSEYEDPLPGFEKVRFRLSFTDYEHDEIERSEEHTSELQSLMRISYAVFCLKKKKQYYNSCTTLYKNNYT